MWTPFLCVITLLSSHVSAQNPGFLSLDCGGTQNFTDTTGIEWVPDDKYITTGSVASVSEEFPASRPYQTLRYFPGPKRKHCYELPVIPNRTYIIRPYFLYGNYDSLRYAPPFDLLVGANLFYSVDVNELPINGYWYYEFVVTAPNDKLHFCLGSTSGSNDVPFISALELRPMGRGMYQTEPQQGLSLWRRFNVGATTPKDIRYPDDDYDRRWTSDAPGNKYPIMSTNSTVSSQTAPSSVMRTAITSNTFNTSIVFDFGVQINSTKSHYVAFYFAEFPTVSTLSLREFIITRRKEGLFNGPLNVRAISGELNSLQLYDNTFHGSTSLMFIPTTRSTLGPILNAAEILEILSNLTLETDRDDVRAINDVKTHFHLLGWSGDPCLPLPYTWDWLTCDTKQSPAIITALNLSNFQLNGSIPQSISQLTHLTSILLDNNNLIGTIPDLSSLKNLTTLSLLNNNLSGCVLPEFRAGLTVNVSGNPTSSCSPKHSHPQTIALAVAIPSAVVLLGVLLLLACFCSKRKAKKPRTSDTHSSPSDDQEQKPTTNVKCGARHVSTQNFQYEEILEATSAFQKKIGEGGFGPVYYGQLAYGQEVAVKVNSRRSSQGEQEFNNEIDVLSVVHHKNLVSFLGYCSHGSSLLLIYEYLPNGTLREHLYGTLHPPLSWKERLNIALDAAQGLDYLHTACHPRIIHRDVKSSNIFLTTALVAKVADFGLSKLYNKDDASHVSTMVKGTIGYLDPEYHSWGRLTEKSDVYSFGVVLFEIISGRPPISLMFPREQVSLVKWACMQIHKGELESVRDSRLSNYNKESMWKVAEVAMACIEVESVNRPTMNTVVNELKEAIRLEESPLTDL